MRHGNLDVAAARAASPWFFPSVAWMRTALTDIGFKVEQLELEYRPTKLVSCFSRVLIFDHLPCPICDDLSDVTFPYHTYAKLR